MDPVCQMEGLAEEMNLRPGWLLSRASLLCLPNDVLATILREIVDDWREWHRLSLVCKRFNIMLKHRRQEAILDYLSWEEPLAGKSCRGCERDLPPDPILTYEFEMLSRDCMEEFWETHCSVECAFKWRGAEDCCHCGGDALMRYNINTNFPGRYSKVPEEVKLECIKCNPYVFDEITVGKRFRPRTKKGKAELRRQLRTHEHYSDDCVMCGEECLGDCAVLELDIGSHVKYCTVCSYTCFSICDSKVIVKDHDRPSHWITAANFD